MKKRLLITLLFLTAFCCGEGFAQNSDKKRTNHWYFGTRAGVDFSSGTAVADTNGKLTSLQGMSTMSDTSGNLLFYTDGKTVWNAQHDSMPNGTGIGVGHNATPVKGVVIVPKPMNNSIYYIFVVDGWEHQFLNGLRYSIVDMTLDSGRGSVTQKNILLFGPTTEQLGVIKDATGCGYWILSHERYSDKFRSYHLTNNGIDTNAVITAIAPDYGYMASFSIYAGGAGITFSPNGNLFGTIDWWGWRNGTGIPDSTSLYHFDRNTGIVSNKITLDIDTMTFAIGISPDNTKLYLYEGYNLAKLYQYDISNYSSISIQSSKTFIHAGNDLPTDYRQGIDGKLHGCSELRLYLSTIHNPNASGQACNFVKNNTSLGGRTGLMELPNFVESFFDSSSACVTSVNEIENSGIHIYPNLVRDWIVVEGNDFEQVRLVDITGRLVYLTSPHNVSLDHIRINVSSYPRGIYIVSVISQNKSVNRKIILY